MTTNIHKIVNAKSIFDKNGFLSVLGNKSESSNKKTKTDNITVTENDILSPDFQGINILAIISDAVKNVGIIILNS